VVHDGLAQLQAPRHGHVECVSRVLFHGARPERQADGVTRLGQNCVFLYFYLALSSHCGFFRSSVRLARSLLEHLFFNTVPGLNAAVLLHGARSERRSEDALIQSTLPESASGALELPCLIAIMARMFSYLDCSSSSST